MYTIRVLGVNWESFGFRGFGGSARRTGCSIPLVGAISRPARGPTKSIQVASHGRPGQRSIMPLSGVDCRLSSVDASGLRRRSTGCGRRAAGRAGHDVGPPSGRLRDCFQPSRPGSTPRSLGRCDSGSGPLRRRPASGPGAGGRDHWRPEPGNPADRARHGWGFGGWHGSTAAIARAVSALAGPRRGDPGNPRENSTFRASGGRNWTAEGPRHPPAGLPAMGWANRPSDPGRAGRRGAARPAA